MAANKNAVKVGLRIFTAITLIYLVYNLIPNSNYPVRYNKHTDQGSAQDNLHNTTPPSSKPDVHHLHHSHHSYDEPVVAKPNHFPSDGHVYAAASLNSAAAPSQAANAVSLAPSQNSTKWLSRSYNDTSLSTPIQHLTLTNSDVLTAPALLVCVMTKDADSWGDGNRNFSSFLDMLKWTELDPATISLAFLTSSTEEFETYRSDTVDTSYASVHLILHPGYKDAGGSRGFRHSSSIQHARRVEMARLRNYATITSLELSHQHVLWIDSDVYELSTGLIQNMLNFSAKYPQAGIQTAISLLGDGNGDYDWNAWQGERSKPDDKEREKLRKDKGSWTASGINGKSKHMGDFRDDSVKTRDKQKQLKDSDTNFEHGGAFDPSKAVFDEDDEEPTDSQSLSKSDSPDEIEGLFRLDAVGATILLIKSSLWRQGLSFATSYLVGTDWQDEGWDGVESEGLCVTARNLINEEYGRQGGVGCWGVTEGYTRHSSG